MSKWPPSFNPGDITVENPDGVTKTFGHTQKHSLYDAAYVGDGRSYGAFPHEDGFAWCEPKRKSNGDVVPSE